MKNSTAESKPNRKAPTAAATLAAITSPLPRCDDCPAVDADPLDLLSDMGPPASLARW